MKLLKKEKKIKNKNKFIDDRQKRNQNKMQIVELKLLYYLF